MPRFCHLYRRANFTSADMREADFSGSLFTGGYLEKAVAFRANFSGMATSKRSAVQCVCEALENNAAAIVVLAAKI